MHLETQAIWAINPLALSAAVSSLTPKAEWFDDYVTKRKPMRVDGRTAHIDISGPLGSNLPPIAEKVGWTSYETLRDEIEQAKAAGVQHIDFHVNSPGGMVTGCMETANAIGNLGGAGISSRSIVSGMACSAGYWLASQTDQIEAEPSAAVGNIGVVMAFVDASAAYDKMGVKIEVLHNTGATLKGTFREPSLSDDQRAFLQESLDDTGAMFHAYVSAARNVDPVVWKAGWYSGEKAKALGLIDKTI